MNTIETLKNDLQLLLPEARMTIDRPSCQKRVWWLDVTFGKKSAVVEWKPKSYFGVSTPPHYYGEEPDETYLDASPVLDRLIQILTQEQ